MEYFISRYSQKLTGWSVNPHPVIYNISLSLVELRQTKLNFIDLEALLLVLTLFRLGVGVRLPQFLSLYFFCWVEIPNLSFLGCLEGVDSWFETSNTKKAKRTNP